MRIFLCYLVLCCCVSAASQDISSAATSNRPRRIRISGGVLGGVLEHGVKPAYPEQAIRSTVEGDVILMVQTDETGIIARSLPVEGVGSVKFKESGFNSQSSAPLSHSSFPLREVCMLRSPVLTGTCGRFAEQVFHPAPTEKAAAMSAP